MLTIRPGTLLRTLSHYNEYTRFFDTHYWTYIRFQSNPKDAAIKVISVSHDRDSNPHSASELESDALIRLASNKKIKKQNKNKFKQHLKKAKQ